MKKVVSVENMRKSDEHAIKSGTPGKDLMYRAGYAAYKSAEYKEPVAIVCGTGNNAGDGYVLAYLLKDRAKKCKIFLLADKFSSDGRFFYEKCIEKGVETELCDSDTDFSSFNTVVDCIFGTGFKGEPRGLARDIIEKINASSAYVISLDINSGLNGDNGLGDICVRSDLTVSIGDFKSGHFLGRAKDVIKSKIDCDIGIELQEPTFGCLKRGYSAFICASKLFQQGDYGYVALIGGSFEYSGAAKLANLACSALRAGAGVAKLAVPCSLRQAVLPYLLDSTLFLLSDDNGSIVFDKEETDKLLHKTEAVAIGMGLGRSAHIRNLLTYVLSEYNGRVIIDADGLNALAAMDKDILSASKARVILTPHLKEFERLSGATREEINCNPIKSAMDFAQKYNIILLLKGPTTVITDGTTVYLTDRGAPGMATGGSGDVLSGILAGICGYVADNDLLLGVAAAAYINGLAGELAQAEKNEVSMLASDTAGCIGKAISVILDKE